MKNQSAAAALCLVSVASTTPNFFCTLPLRVEKLQPVFLKPTYDLLLILEAAEFVDQEDSLGAATVGKARPLLAQSGSAQRYAKTFWPIAR